MIGNYQGNYFYNTGSVQAVAVDTWGIYYCGRLDPSGKLLPLYIGRACGEGVSVRSRLLDHLRQDQWSDVTHFGYRTGATSQEVVSFEATEIAEFNPKYNQRVG
ncbi:hypothetical protein A3B57_02260 [Microgenomates group bacterium RIFCSPLOWO2_01_FULL_47_10]|nr:MAG: hypothetical protein A3B57_02260 [Microgenomates group bacterium RIFCSPLOWO2_01_FULL_47_10]